MKINIKRTLLFLCMAFCMVLFTACSSSDKGSGQMIEPGVSEQLEAFSSYFFESTATSDVNDIESQMAAAEKSNSTVIAEAYKSWLSVRDDCGVFIGIEGMECSVNDDDEYVCEAHAEFQNRMCDMKIIVTDDLSEIVSISFSPKYTVAENMTKAALNTLMGMGIVFIVLIFLSMLISLFKYISVIEKKMKEKDAASAPATAPAPAAAPVVEEEDVTDDTELVAVIAAAIAAAENTSADGLVVRSIRRAKNAGWKRA